MRLARIADAPRYVWKNGAGHASRIATSGGEPPDWQISVADLERDAPFSRYDSVDRQFLVLDGAVRLTCTEPGFDRFLGPLEPFAFRGEWPIECTLPQSRPATALNVMTRRGGGWAASIEPIRLAGVHVVEKPAGQTVFIVVVQPDLRALAGGAALELTTPHDALVLDAPGTEQASLSPVMAGASIAVIRLVRSVVA